MIETNLKNASHSKDRHVLRTILLLGHAMFDYLTLQKSSGITVDGVQLNGVDHTAPGLCTKEMHYPTESHMAIVYRPRCPQASGLRGHSLAVLLRLSRDAQGAVARLAGERACRRRE